MSGLIDMWSNEVAKFKDKGKPYFHIEKAEPQIQSKGSRATTRSRGTGEAGVASGSQYQPQQQERFPVLGMMRIKASTSNAPLVSDEALYMVFDCSVP